MKKFIFKKFKFILSVLMIESLIFPAFSYIGDFDAGAFVTEAEFNSALADFNTRLSTFETGINSKIDTQVSSYLDRNGIWNRDEIVLNSTNFTYNPTSKKYNRTLSFNSSYQGNPYEAATYGTSFLSPDNWGQLCTAVIGVYDVDTGSPSVYNKNFKPVKVVDEIEKSGLMHIVIDISCKDSYKRSGCYGYIAHSGSLLSYIQFPPLVRASLCFCEQDIGVTDSTFDLLNPGEKGRIVFQKIDWYNTKGATDCIVGTSSVDTGTYVLYFFVSKGNALWQYINGSGGFNYFTAANNWADYRSSFIWNAGDSNLPIYVDERIGIY